MQKLLPLVLIQGDQSQYMVRKIAYRHFPILINQFRKINIKAKTTALHYTSISNLNLVLGMQNSNKPICTTNKIDYDVFNQGIATAGGACLVLEGIPIFYFSNDVYSSFDNKGRRWLDFILLVDHFKTSSTYNGEINSIITNLKQQYFKQLKAFIFTFGKQFKELSQFKQDYQIIDAIAFNKDYYKQFIDNYFKLVQNPFFNRNFQKFSKVFKYSKPNSIKGYSQQSSLDQILLINFNIKKAILDKDKINDHYKQQKVKLLKSKLNNVIIVKDKREFLSAL